MKGFLHIRLYSTYQSTTATFAHKVIVVPTGKTSKSHISQITDVWDIDIHSAHVEIRAVTSRRHNLPIMPWKKHSSHIYWWDTVRSDENCRVRFRIVHFRCLRNALVIKKPPKRELKKCVLSTVICFFLEQRVPRGTSSQFIWINRVEVGGVRRVAKLRNVRRLLLTQCFKVDTSEERMRFDL